MSSYFQKNVKKNAASLTLKCQKLCAQENTQISIGGAGESSAHLWISHLPHALHHEHQDKHIHPAKRINIRIQKEKKNLHQLQNNCSSQPGEINGFAFQRIKGRSVGPVWILCPASRWRVTVDVHSGAVRRALSLRRTGLWEEMLISLRRVTGARTAPHPTHDGGRTGGELPHRLYAHLARTPSDCEGSIKKKIK